MATGYAELGLWHTKLDDSLTKQDAFAQGFTDPGSLNLYKSYPYSFDSFGDVLTVVATNKFHIQFGSLDEDTADQTSNLNDPTLFDQHYEISLRRLIPGMITKTPPSFFPPGGYYPSIGNGASASDSGDPEVSLVINGPVYFWQGKFWLPIVITVSSSTANGSTLDDGSAPAGTAKFFGKDADMFCTFGSASPTITWVSGF